MRFVGAPCTDPPDTPVSDFISVTCTPALFSQFQRSRVPTSQYINCPDPVLVIAHVSCSTRNGLFNPYLFPSKSAPALSVKTRRNSYGCVLVRSHKSEECQCYRSWKAASYRNGLHVQLTKVPIGDMFGSCSVPGGLSNRPVFVHVLRCLTFNGEKHHSCQT